MSYQLLKTAQFTLYYRIVRYQLSDLGFKKILRKILLTILQFISAKELQACFFAFFILFFFKLFKLVVWNLDGLAKLTQSS